MTSTSLPASAAVVIIGGGMAGLSCAASLARRGIRDVILLEGKTLAHARASSFGETRMFREMYSDPVLCRLAQEANRLWREEEAHAGEVLRDTHGLLFYGESWDEETIEGSIPGARKVMDDQGIPYEALNAAQIAERFPLKPKADFTGLFEPTAGAVRSDKVIAHWVRTARQAGHQVLEHSPVSSIDADGGGVTLEGGHHISAGHVVVACGIWSQLLLAPLGLAPKLEIWPMLWAHYTVDPALASRYPQWFCFQKERGDDGGLYYGFPSLSTTADGRPRIKAGIDWSPKELRVAEPNTMCTEAPARLLELLDTFLFNELDGVQERVETVMSPYSMTSDVNFVLDRLTPKLSLFAGGSGQSFKFAPLIGDSLARLASGEQPAADISCWSHQRDAVRA
ncbi:FAD-dependent oxidoreductase [Synechococcus sp. ROS8604]|uniref:FAD-dependent oxidoreductase n=1 Tax=Synechococcus sp. ROS8604 TaxID=1442557 RepID=UPI0016453549|nr:FAD-dependent oxidoreductase [Synechococcus sp. ROS8604]QNI87120.1 sarcosine oxidase [Synechococcus sp. ROS8604]